MRSDLRYELYMINHQFNLVCVHNSYSSIQLKRIQREEIISSSHQQSTISSSTISSHLIYNLISLTIYHLIIHLLIYHLINLLTSVMKFMQAFWTDLSCLFIAISPTPNLLNLGFTSSHNLLKMKNKRMRS